MDIKIGYSYLCDAEGAVGEASKEFDSPETILFFAPTGMFRQVSAELSRKFPGCTVVGASTHVAFFENRRWDTDEGITVVGMGKTYECAGGVIEDIRICPIRYADQVAASVKSLKNTENTVCLSFTNAFFSAEELVLDTLAQGIGKAPIPVVGSTCGNADDSSDTLLSFNGQVYSEASVYLFIHNRCGAVAIAKENLYVPTRRTFTVTSADVANRIVYELDGVPAAIALARSLKKTEGALSERISDYPLGLIEGNEINIAEMHRINPDHSIGMFTSVFAGTRLCLMEPRKYNSCLSDMLDDIRKHISKPGWILYINCMSLTRLYREEDWLPVFTAGLGNLDSPFAGISGYGEQLGRVNMNKSFLAVAFE